jgi:hypothetical protein
MCRQMEDRKIKEMQISASLLRIQATNTGNRVYPFFGLYVLILLHFNLTIDYSEMHDRISVNEPKYTSDIKMPCQRTYPPALPSTHGKVNESPQ